MYVTCAATVGLSAARLPAKAARAWAARLLGGTAAELEGTITIEAPARLTRRGVETKLVIEADRAMNETTGPDPALIKAVARGHAWFDDLVSGRAGSVRAIARR